LKKVTQNIFKSAKNQDIFEIHVSQRLMAKGEQMEEIKLDDLDCEAENCSFPVEVEIEVERNKTHKSKMLLCESHAELIEKGIPFKVRAIKKG
jgi:hypothetical protein